MGPSRRHRTILWRPRGTGLGAGWSGGRVGAQWTDQAARACGPNHRVNCLRDRCSGLDRRRGRHPDAAPAHCRFDRLRRGGSRCWWAGISFRAAPDPRPGGLLVRRLLGRIQFEAGALAFLAAHLLFCAAFALGASLLCASAPPCGVARHHGRIAVWLVPWCRGTRRWSSATARPSRSWWCSPAAWRRGPAAAGPGGAVCFYVSDIFVARGQFIGPSPWNAFGCYPLYYGACFLLALSAGGRRRAASRACQTPEPRLMRRFEAGLRERRLQPAGAWAAPHGVACAPASPRRATVAVPSGGSGAGVQP